MSTCICIPPGGEIGSPIFMPGDSLSLVSRTVSGASPHRNHPAYQHRIEVAALLRDRYRAVASALGKHH
jgi:hypothetical protein